jgi:hypothetical protein
MAKSCPVRHGKLCLVVLLQGLQTADDLMHLYDSINTWLLQRGTVSTMAAVEADQLGKGGPECCAWIPLQLSDSPGAYCC